MDADEEFRDIADRRNSLLSRSSWLPHVEDFLLSAWVAFVGPALIRVQNSSAGLFDASRPIDGLLDLVAVVGAVICLASRDPDRSRSSSISAFVGPFVGGLLLISISASTALGLTSVMALFVIGVVGVISVLVRTRLPTLPIIVRRALVTPYVLVTGSLFWRVIDAVTGGGDLISRLRVVSLSDFQSIEPIIGFLLAFSAIYYAMLVYAPRQVAEPEGSLFAWLVRYLLFVFGMALGAAWLISLGS